MLCLNDALVILLSDGTDCIWNDVAFNSVPLYRNISIWTNGYQPGLGDFNNITFASCCNPCCGEYTDQTTSGTCSAGDLCQNPDGSTTNYCETWIGSSLPYCAGSTTLNGQPAIGFASSGEQPNDAHNTMFFSPQCAMACSDPSCVFNVTATFAVKSDNPIPDNVRSLSVWHLFFFLCVCSNVFFCL